MKKLFFLTLGVTLCIFIASTCFASPSAKFTAYVNDIVFSEGPSGSATLTAGIKVGSKKDLLIGVSLQTGIWTQTLVKGKKGGESWSSAEGTIEVCVTLEKDGNTDYSDHVKPDCVIYDSRYQKLRAILGGVETCVDTGTFMVDIGDPSDPLDDECVETCYEETCSGGTIACTDPTAVSCQDGNVTIPCECEFSDEEIELILDTMGAHHFNFVAKDLDAGEYTLTATVTGTTDVGGDPTTGVAKVSVGPGSLTVEEVRATNNPNGIVFD